MSELRTAPSRPYTRRTDFLTLLRLDEVLVRVGLGKTRLYALLAAGDFPTPIRLGQRSVRWHAQDIHAWIEAKRNASADELDLPPIPLSADSSDVEKEGSL